MRATVGSTWWNRGPRRGVRVILAAVLIGLPAAPLPALAAAPPPGRSPALATEDLPPDARQWFETEGPRDLLLGAIFHESDFSGMILSDIARRAIGRPVQVEMLNWTFLSDPDHRVTPQNVAAPIQEWIAPVVDTAGRALGTITAWRDPDSGEVDLAGIGEGPDIGEVLLGMAPGQRYVVSGPWTFLIDGTAVEQIGVSARLVNPELRSGAADLEDLQAAVVRQKKEEVAELRRNGGQASNGGFDLVLQAGGSQELRALREARRRTLRLLEVGAFGLLTLGLVGVAARRGVRSARDPRLVGGRG